MATLISKTFPWDWQIPSSKGRNADDIDMKWNLTFNSIEAERSITQKLFPAAAVCRRTLLEFIISLYSNQTASRHPDRIPRHFVYRFQTAEGDDSGFYVALT
jgi:hypothetical protein